MGWSVLAATSGPHASLLQSRMPYPMLTLVQRHLASVEAQPKSGANASIFEIQVCSELC
jgi:hypothetical protein